MSGLVRNAIQFQQPTIVGQVDDILLGVVMELGVLLLGCTELNDLLLHERLK